MEKGMRVNLTAPPPPIFPFFFLWLFCFQIIASGVCPAFSSKEAAAAAIAFRKHDEGNPTQGDLIIGSGRGAFLCSS